MGPNDDGFTSDVLVVAQELGFRKIESDVQARQVVEKLHEDYGCTYVVLAKSLSSYSPSYFGQWVKDTENPPLKVGVQVSRYLNSMFVTASLMLSRIEDEHSTPGDAEGVGVGALDDDSGSESQGTPSAVNGQSTKVEGDAVGPVSTGVVETNVPVSVPSGDSRVLELQNVIDSQSEEIEMLKAKFLSAQEVIQKFEGDLVELQKRVKDSEACAEHSRSEMHAALAELDIANGREIDLNNTTVSVD